MPIKNVTPGAELALVKRDDNLLSLIADDIRTEYGKGIEAQFAIGHLLRQAAAEFPPAERGKDEKGQTKGSPFGEWFRAQEFPFNIVTAWRLRSAAEREDEVRAFIASKSTSTSRDIGPATAIQYMNAKPKDTYGRAEDHGGGDTGQYEPVHTPFKDFRQSVRTFLGWYVDPEDDEGVGKYTLNPFIGHGMHADDIAEARRLIQDLVDAYVASRS